MGEIITSSGLPAIPQPKPLSRESREEAARSLGLTLHATSCPKCGSEMFLKRAPCFMRKKGFRLAARCISCGHQEGVRR